MLLTLGYTFQSVQRDNPSRVPWEHRYIWNAWHDWQQAYFHFALLCFDEAAARGIVYSQNIRTRIAQKKQEGRWRKPLWVGWDALHTEYRANLQFQGLCETAIKRLCAHIGCPQGVLSHGVEEWLEAHHLPPYFQIDQWRLLEIDRALNNENAPNPKWPNHYDQFDWSEEATCHMTRSILEPNQES